jgi:hypothetical protein
MRYDAIARNAISTNTSKYSIESARGSGVTVLGCSYPDSNSGFGKRCCWAVSEKVKSKK